MRQGHGPHNGPEETERRFQSFGGDEDWDDERSSDTQGGRGFEQPRPDRGYRDERELWSGGARGRERGYQGSQGNSGYETWGGQDMESEAYRTPGRGYQGGGQRDRGEAQGYRGYQGGSQGQGQFGGEYGRGWQGSRGSQDWHGSQGQFGGEQGRGWQSQQESRGSLREGGYSGQGQIQSGRHVGQGPRNYKRSDDRIREDVCDRLTENGHIDASNIDVAVQNGEVTLKGFVGERQMKRIAEDLVENLPGVKEVTNQIRVQQSSGSTHEGSTSNMQKEGKSTSKS